MGTRADVWEVILDASRHPHGRGTLTSEGDPAAIGGEATVTAVHESCSAARSHQFNPTCGDEVTVHVEVSDSEPRRIESVVWDGQGCSISQASLSIMVDLVEGKTVDEAMELFGQFHKLMESRGAGLDDEQAEDALGDAAVFQGVSNTRCASNAHCSVGRGSGTHWRRPSHPSTPRQPSMTR